VQKPSLKFYNLVKKFAHFLWNPKLHYCVQKRQTLDLILCQSNPAPVITLYSLNIHFSILLLSKPRSLKVVSFPEVSWLLYCMHFSSIIGPTSSEGNWTDYSNYRRISFLPTK